jgi:hypothetical protein
MLSLTDYEQAVANETLQRSAHAILEEAQRSPTRLRVPCAPSSGENGQAEEKRGWFRNFSENTKLLLFRTIFSPTAAKSSYWSFPDWRTTKVYKHQLIACRLEMIPRLDHDRVKPIWFVRVTIFWRSGFRFRFDTIMPPDSFHSEEMAIENGFRVGELWVDQRLSSSNLRVEQDSCL